MPLNGPQLAFLDQIVWHDPLWIAALAAIPAVLWIRRRRSLPVLLVPFAAVWHRPGAALSSRWPAILAVTGFVFLAAALARPQRIEDQREVQARGYDIVLSIDLSTSMLAEDYERDGLPVNRLQAIKPIIQAFINNRANDRIGLVVFAGRAYTMAPLTFDHAWLERQTERLKLGLIEDGTAIGDGLGVALTRLEQAKHEQGGKREGAFVVLLTDGANNRGSLEPLDAGRLARTRGIPVYTIGAGRPGLVPYPVLDDRNRRIGMQLRTSDIDEETLHALADMTGGRFFRATDTGTIEEAFEAIDRAQKIEFQARTYLVTSELFAWFAAPGALLLLAAGVAARVGRRAPVTAAPIRAAQPT